MTPDDVRRGRTATTTDPARARDRADSQNSSAHAGQEADRVDATIRNTSEGYGGPQIDEHRDTPRDVAKRERQKDR